MSDKLSLDFEQHATMEDGAGDPVLTRCREGVGNADAFVRANPWRALGIGVCAGILLGVLAAR